MKKCKKKQYKHNYLIYRLQSYPTQKKMSMYGGLEELRTQIEALPKFNQVEVLRILSKHSDITLNENKYGTHINMSDLQPSIIQLLQNYLSYVSTQESDLRDIEKQKEEFKVTYFSKDNKETSKMTYNTNARGLDYVSRTEAFQQQQNSL